MIPILFEYNETDFSTHGLGDLVDCISCQTACNADGEYELSFTYPRTGELFQELTIGRLIYAKANHWQQNQIFRIYGYEKEIGEIITVNCEHISYDLNRIPVKTFKAATTDKQTQVLAKIKTNSLAITGLNISKFTFSSEITDSAKTQEGYYELSSPSSARAAILDGDDSVKGVFGGNLVLDNYNVKFCKPNTEEGGMNRGVLIEYGTDLIDLNQEENISEMYTGVLPYYHYMANSGDEKETYVYTTIQYATLDESYSMHRIYPLDVTEYFPNQAEHTRPSDSAINTKAQSWMAKEPNFGRPEVNLTISYAKLGQDVRLHDQVTVRFVKMGIEESSKVTSYKYDVLSEKMLEVEVGESRKSILFSLEDASRLKKGLLPPKRIQNKSLTSEKYADGSVQSASIGTGAVGTSKISSDAVTSDKLCKTSGQEAVTVNTIRNGAVQTIKIDDDAVTTPKVLDKAIELAKLSKSLQDDITYIPTLASDLAVINRLIAGRIQADGTMQCTSIIVGSTQYRIARTIPGTSWQALCTTAE